MIEIHYNIPEIGDDRTLFSKLGMIKIYSGVPNFGDYINVF